MAGQEQSRTERSRPEPDHQAEPLPAAGLTARKAELDHDLDAVLDEIDAVLEGNAEEFVRGFIQKGGQ